MVGGKEKKEVAEKPGKPRGRKLAYTEEAIRVALEGDIPKAMEIIRTKGRAGRKD
jgi:hypothetical protein